MQIGIVGKSNTGKSTFFKALTLADIEIANRPFVTINKNEGVGFVKVECADKEFDKQCNPRLGYCEKHQRFVPIDLIDVAGLVPNAHKGQGLGNQFLSDLNQADALIHIIDISGSTNAQGEPIEAASYEPENDIKFLEHELDQWYLGIFNKVWDKFSRQVMQEKKELPVAIADQFSGLGAGEDMIKEIFLKENFSADVSVWNELEVFRFTQLLRRKTKPMIIACNKIDVPGAEDNFKRLKAKYPEYIMVGTSSESELALKEAKKHGLIDYIHGESKFSIKAESKLNEQQKKGLDFMQNFLDKFGSTGVQDVIDKAAYELLKLIAVFPVPKNLHDSDGNYFPDCFLIPEGSTALDFAYKVHTDLGKNFIRAIDLKTKMVIGKDHKLSHRDVIEIIT